MGSVCAVGQVNAGFAELEISKGQNGENKSKWARVIKWQLNGAGELTS